MLDRFVFVEFRIDGEDIRVMLWDTAGLWFITMLKINRLVLHFNAMVCFCTCGFCLGQEEFDAITKAYYRGAQACVLAFSTTDRMSFEAIKEWKMKVRVTNGNGIFACVCVCVLGMKCNTFHLTRAVDFDKKQNQILRFLSTVCMQFWSSYNWRKVKGSSHSTKNFSIIDCQFISGDHMRIPIEIVSTTNEFVLWI